MIAPHDPRDNLADEARDLVRRAVGDASGLTVKGQIRRAAQNLGYTLDAWRVREAWYGRAGRSVGGALRELRDRFEAWRGRKSVGAQDPFELAGQVGAVRRLVTELDQRVAELERSVAQL